MAKAAVAAPVAALLTGTASAATAGRAVTTAGGRRAVSGGPGASFSRAVILDKLVYCAGVVGRKPGPSSLASTQFGPQCRQTFENLKASVEASGSTMAQVLKCTCFLTNVTDFATMNELFREFFASSPPARSTVVVKELVVPGALIEVDCVASLA